MRFTALSSLYLALAPWAPGLNEDSALDELRRATRQFCRATNISAESFETSLASGDRQIAFEPPGASVLVHRVLWVQAPYGPITLASLDELNRESGWRTATGDPNACSPEASDANELVLNRAPTRSIDPVYVRMACQPTLTATEIDTRVAEEWGEAVIDLALKRILSIPKQTWTDPAEAERRYRDYLASESRARAQATVNNAFTTIRTPFPRLC